MPVFKYEAIDTHGRALNGTMPAHDEGNLEQKLKALGLWLTEAVLDQPGAAPGNARADQFWARFNQKRLRRELIDFCTVMDFQVRVGIPLVRALEAASQDCKSDYFKAVLTGLQGHVESGLHFYEALAQYPNVFSPHFISVVRAGELSSKLPEAFTDLRDYLEWVERVVADVRQATIYPAIVMTVITGFVLFLFTFIIPQFADLLNKLHVKQPLITRMVFVVGEMFKSTWWIWLPCFTLALVGIPVGRRYSPGFALAVDRLKLRLPVFGPLNGMLALSRFTHNLAILYKSGLPILQALELCTRGLIGNLVVENAVVEVGKDVKTGSTISEAMHRHQVFSAMLLRMVGMGEATGNLDQALQNVADYYNEVIPRRIKSVFSVLEPALMLVLIFLVGCVALAIYLPILSLIGGIRQ